MPDAKRPDLAGDVWRPQAVKGDGFALQALAEALHACHRIDDAIPVFQRANEAYRRKWGEFSHVHGDREWNAACRAVIDLLIEDGRDHQALTWLRRVMKAGPAPKWALEELTWRLERAGELDEAESWLRYAVDREAEGWYRDPNPDVPGPFEKLYQFLLRTGRISQAEELLRDPSARGLAAARREVFRSFEAAARDADLSASANAMLADGQQQEFDELARHFERVDATDEAIAMWLAAAEQGNFHARWEAVRLMDRNGHAGEAEAWLRDLIRAGQTPPTEMADPEEDLTQWHAQNRARDRGRDSPESVET